MNIFNESILLMEPRAAMDFWLYKLSAYKKKDDASPDKILERFEFMKRCPTKITVGGKTLEVFAQTGGGRIAQGYMIVGGIAIVPILGPIFKGMGQYGYADFAELRATIRFARNDSSVHGVLLFVDSPGGGVAGAGDLADEIRAMDQVKPVAAYVEDLAASAAVWSIAHARHVTINNTTAQIGSIGVVTQLVDSSQMHNSAGVYVYPMVTGKFKAVGMDGVEITREQVAYIQGLVNQIYNQFAGDVVAGRKVSRAVIDQLQGAVVTAKRGVRLGLANKIGSLDEAYAAIRHEAEHYGGLNGRARSMIAEMEAEA